MSDQSNQETPSSPASGLGVVVTNKTARRVIYGAYVGAAVVVGGVAAYFIGTQHPLPEAVIGAQSVIAYLGIPVGGLAIANTGK